MAFTALATRVYKDPITTVYLNSIKQNDDYLITGIAKTWGAFSSSATVTALGSLNVSSLTDSGAGSFTINFTTGYTVSGYAVMGEGHRGTPNQTAPLIVFAQILDTGSCKILTQTVGGGNEDTDYFSFAIFGDGK